MLAIKKRSRGQIAHQPVHYLDTLRWRKTCTKVMVEAWLEDVVKDDIPVSLLSLPGLKTFVLVDGGI